MPPKPDPKNQLMPAAKKKPLPFYFSPPLPRINALATRTRRFREQVSSVRGRTHLHTSLYYFLLFLYIFQDYKLRFVFSTKKSRLNRDFLVFWKLVSKAWLFSSPKQNPPFGGFWLGKLVSQVLFSSLDAIAI